MTTTIRQASETPGALRCAITGTGPAWVLIHGVGLNSAAWDPLLPLLGLHGQIHAIDLPGHGGSPLGDAARLSDYTDRVAAYIETLEDPVRVVGHSMGAMIALDLAGRSLPLAGLCALNAIYQRDALAHKAVKARAAALSATDVNDPGPTLARWFDSEAQVQARKACHTMLTSVDPLGYKTAYGVFATENGPSADQLRAMALPALFLTGTNDPNSTPAMSAHMADLAPQGRAQCVPNAAHMLPMTHPQALAAALVTWANP